MLIITQAVASFTFISPFSSSIVALVTTQIAKVFGITNPVEQELVYSVFVLGYAFGSLFSSTISENVRSLKREKFVRLMRWIPKANPNRYSTN